MPSLVTEGSAAQKVSRQTSAEILNLLCDLDHEHSKPIFLLDTLDYDDVPWN